MNELEIKSWKKFLSRNKDIENEIEMASNDIYKIVSNLEFIKSKIETIGTTVFEQLQKVKKGKKDELSITTEDLKALSSAAQSIIDNFSLETTKVLGALAAAEYLIDRYNKGLYNEEEKNSIFQTIASITNYSGMFWIIAAGIDKTKFPTLSLLFGITANSVDISEGGAYIFGETGKNFTGWLINKIPGTVNHPELTKFTGGALVAMAYTACCDMLLDKGDFTKLDRKRITGHMLENGINFVVWEKVFELAGGGALGATAASLYLLPIALLGDLTVKAITGDIVLEEIKGTDCITGEETTYTIYKNGGGPNGTYDVYRDTCVDLNRKYEINGRTYTETNFKKIMYDDWKNVCDSRIHFPKESELNSMLKKLREAKNFSEANKIKEEIQRECKTDYIHGHETPTLYDQLSARGFDLDEYYLYYHPSAPIKHRYSGIQE